MKAMALLIFLLVHKIINYFHCPKVVLHIPGCPGNRFVPRQSFTHCLLQTGLSTALCHYHDCVKASCII